MNKAIKTAYVGCRTTRERNARGDGLYVYDVPADGSPWRQKQLVTRLVNPSYLAFDRTGMNLYSIHGDSSEITAFRIDRATGMVEQINQVTTKGKNPVHLAVDPSNRFIVIANHVTYSDYASSIAVISRRFDGGLGEMTDHVALTGKTGPHRFEQPFAKPHQCLFDPSGRYIAIPDKGLDHTACYRLSDKGRLTLAGPPAPSREGEGPRHLAFHPEKPFAYVLNELSSTITACALDDAGGAITPFQVISSLPDSFTGFSRAAEIDMSQDGRFVYASNRGFDTIGVFRVDDASGRLSPFKWVDSGGRTPRFFALSPAGDQLFVANEDSDNIIRFHRNAVDGDLRNPASVAKPGSPTCILFATAWP